MENSDITHEILEILKLLILQNPIIGGIVVILMMCIIGILIYSARTSKASTTQAENSNYILDQIIKISSQLESQGKQFQAMQEKNEAMFVKINTDLTKIDARVSTLELIHHDGNGKVN